MTKTFPGDALKSAIQFMDSHLEVAGLTDRVATVRSTTKSKGTRWRHVEFLDKHGKVLASFRVDSLQVGEGESRKYQIVVTPLISSLVSRTSTSQPTTPEPSLTPLSGLDTEDPEL